MSGLRAGLGGRQWQRWDAIRHWLLPALLPALLTPGFIGTVVFFHQAHVAEVKGWNLVEMAPGFTALAVVGTIASFVAGWAADRYGVHRLLPVLLLPIGIGIGLVGPATHVSAWYVALGLVGMTMGIASALWGRAAASGLRHRTPRLNPCPRHHDHGRFHRDRPRADRHSDRPWH